MVRLVHEHGWDVTPAEGIAIQRQLAQFVVAENRAGDVRAVGGIDVSVRDGIARAAVVSLGYPDLTPQDSVVSQRPCLMPYVPGLLSFREAPAILDALARLQRLPDLLLVDGQGFAHPRRMGLATHLGVLLDHPSIGCAKSRLCGQHASPGPERGDWTPLYDGDEIIGAVVRTRRNTRPVFVSVGHKVDLAAAIAYVLGCCTRYRLPETTRWAHRVAGGDALPAPPAATAGLLPDRRGE